VVPHRGDYDLVDRAACARLVRDHRPEVVFHLAARVGGIGANRDNPGLLLFDDAVMGLQLIEECRLGGVEKVIVAGTVCAYPKYAPVPFRLLLVQAQAYREQYGLNAIMVFPVTLYGPRDKMMVRADEEDVRSAICGRAPSM